MDEEYLSTLGIKLLQDEIFQRLCNRFFSDRVERNRYRLLGWSNNALRHELTHTDNHGQKTSYHVIGVVKDFAISGHCSIFTAGNDHGTKPLQPDC